MSGMFDAAPIAPDIPLQQSPEFERALAATRTPHLRTADGTLILQRSFGRVMVHMMTCPRADLPDDIRQTVRAIGTKSPVIIAPDQPMPLQHIGALPLVSPATQAALDLSPDLQDLRKNLHQKWRNRLKHGGKQRLRVTRQNMPDDPNHWFFQAEARQQLKRRYRNWPLALTLAYGRENRSHAKLFTAFWGKEPVAAILILRHGNSAHYHMGHSKPAGRLASAHTLLLWAAISWAKSKGLAQLDLGLIDTEDGQGLARFKLGTGAQIDRLGGTWLWWPPITRLLRPLARLDRALMENG
ncbi:GNAT family N-acetyltransferase [Roseobacter sp. EG26]|uniref:GNAT family N-acetyltransferase n=1 Tax=Roseobacter sp. EG26 TaxID=3412477 RepID=UPI003CE4F572